MILTVQTKYSELEKSKNELVESINERLNSIVIQANKEAIEKDKHKKKLLEFLSSIGFDKISQSKSNTIIDQINIAPQLHGLQNKINFENGELGFNTDF